MLQSELQHLEVIGGGVGAGVAGPKDGGQWLAGLREVAEQGVKAEAALVVAGGSFLLGVGAQQRGVDVEGDRLRAGARIPGSLQRLCASCANRFQGHGVDRLDRPVGGALGGDRPEQGLLAAQDAEI